MTADGDTLEKFESILVEAGYSPHHSDEYAKMRFHLIEEALFEVTEVFPRIRAQNFERGIPDGIERIEYEINLNRWQSISSSTKIDLTTKPNL